MLAAFFRVTRSCRLRVRSPAILAVSLLIQLQVAPAHASPALVVANWNDYIHPDLVAQFTAETGIPVDYRTFETDEDADALLRQEFPPDVLVPDSHYLPG